MALCGQASETTQATVVLRRRFAQPANFLATSEPSSSANDRGQPGYVFSLHRRVNLAPVQVENADRDRARRPVRLGDEVDGSGGVPRIGVQFPNDVRRVVQEIGFSIAGSELGERRVQVLNQCV